MEPTTKTPTPAADRTDAILGFFDTPEYHSRVRRTRQKQAFHYWKIRLILDASLVALGFILGTLLV